MLKRIKALLDEWDQAADRPDDRLPGRLNALQAAAAALLVEAARQDDTISGTERRRIVDMAKRRFHLAEDEAQELLALAEAETSGAAHHFDYVRTITDKCPPDQRVWIIEMLWEVAYADGRLHDLEASLLRRIGGLLYVSDAERGAARKRVLHRLGLPDEAGL
ncbi:MAG TPA: TerB family tellurite resistance protein [Azospirillaceae bacterium]|nr:TerB family tellurite resistance protein [Azospirillaceae bacterium]